MRNWNYQMERILYRIFKVILNIYKKKHGEKDVNPSGSIYINKIQNRITFKIKTRYYHILLTPETMKLLGSTKSKIINDENGENAPHLEINDVVLVHSNIVNNNYQ